MMPMLFCASFMPWEMPIAAAETICALLNSALTNGVRPNRRRNPVRLASHENSAYSPPIRAKPSTKPISGDTTIGTITLGITPLPDHQLPAAQITAPKLLPAPATAAPTRPPTSAWLELDGRPSHQVSRFQAIAESSAQTSS